VGNHLIDFSDAVHATGSVYCRGQIQDGERWIEQAIHYRDSYERRDGEWLFVATRASALVRRRGRRAAARAAARELAEHHDGRGTLPEEWPSWHAFWKSVGGD
jgi:hypothetical protein